MSTKKTVPENTPHNPNTQFNEYLYVYLKMTVIEVLEVHSAPIYFYCKGSVPALSLKAGGLHTQFTIN